jgi:hypothetical protein
MSHKTRQVILSLVCGLFTCLAHAGCHYNTASEAAYLQEVRFRSAWDYAIGRLSYDQVVKAWGPPTSITSGASPQDALLDTAPKTTPLDAAPIRATWHWNHSLPIVSGTPSPANNLMFGQRMELMFSRRAQILMDWSYWEWGRQALSYRH